MDGVPVALTAPLWLLLLLPVLLVVRGRGRWWRATALAALVVAAAGPVVPAPENRFAVLVDRSDSVGDGAREIGRAAASAGLPDGTDLWWRAADPVQVGSWDAPLGPQAIPGRSDLRRAVSAAVGRGAGRVLLISDGVDTRTGLTSPGAPVPVDVLPVPPVPNVRIEGMDLPVSAEPGAIVRTEVEIRSDRATEAELVVRVNDDDVQQDTLDLPAGRMRTVTSVQLPAREGTVRVEASLQVPWEQPTADDVLVAQIELAARAPVWVIGDPVAADLLRAQGVEVEELEPEEVRTPIDAAAVIVREEASRFTTSQLASLASWVEAGGGLLMTGGPASFGLGGWYRTPVEAVLPVDSDLRSDVEVPLVAMVMVLDRSGSMAAENPSRMALARQGVAEVIELAFERDLLGLVAFDDQSEWVFELRPATSRGKLEMLAALRGVTPRGGTILGPSLVEATEALRASDAAIKHVIVLSDGILYDGTGLFSGPAVDLVGVAESAHDNDITISTIAIGEGREEERLETIARSAGGRYHEAFDVSTLPRIFAGEAMTVSRSLLRSDPGAPAVGTHPLLSGSGAPPGPTAYVATTLKPDAEALWGYADDESLLSVRRHGLGRSAAFTSDLSRWAGDLAAWPEFPGLFADLVRWLAARPDRFAADVRRDGDRNVLVVDAIEDGRFLDGLSLVARSGGEERPLRSVGPGRYRVELPPAVGGEPVVVSDGREVVARARTVAQDPEGAAVDGHEALRRLAAVSGGRVLSADDAARDGWTPTPPRAPRSLAPWVAALAGALLLGELAWRRFRPAA
ncbi:MAG: VWA domain-containing protein [Trueperaceae bacterium]